MARRLLVKMRQRVQNESSDMCARGESLRLRWWRVALCIAIISLTSCISSHQSFVIETTDREWSEQIEVVIPNEDTTSLRDLRIVLRHDNTFKHDKVNVTIVTIRPDSVAYGEEFVLHFADDGRSVSALHDVVCAFRGDVVFNMQGDYHMTITPKESLSGVLAVGVDIVKSE